MRGKTGSSNPNFGSRRSEETKAKMRASFVGRVVSEETKRKLSMYCGPLASNWRGGIQYSPYCPVWGDKEFREFIKERQL